MKESESTEESETENQSDLSSEANDDQMDHNQPIITATEEKTEESLGYEEDDTRSEAKNLKGYWTVEEDALLRSLVVSTKPDWKAISKCIKGRGTKQCRERWSEYVNPILNHSPFTPEEDQIIVEKQQTIGNKWKVIAGILGNQRTPTKVKVRWHTLKRKRTHEMLQDRADSLRSRALPCPTREFREAQDVSSEEYHHQMQFQQQEYDQQQQRNRMLHYTSIPAEDLGLSQSVMHPGGGFTIGGVTHPGHPIFFPSQSQQVNYQNNMRPFNSSTSEMSRGQRDVDSRSLLSEGHTSRDITIISPNERVNTTQQQQLQQLQQSDQQSSFVPQQQLLIQQLGPGGTYASPPQYSSTSLVPSGFMLHAPPILPAHFSPAIPPVPNAYMVHPAYGPRTLIPVMMRPHSVGPIVAPLEPGPHNGLGNFDDRHNVFQMPFVSGRDMYPRMVGATPLPLSVTMQPIQYFHLAQQPYQPFLPQPNTAGHYAYPASSTSGQVTEPSVPVGSIASAFNAPAISVPFLMRPPLSTAIPWPQWRLRTLSTSPSDYGRSVGNSSLTAMRAVTAAVKPAIVEELQPEHPLEGQQSEPQTVGIKRDKPDGDSSSSKANSKRRAISMAPAALSDQLGTPSDSNNYDEVSNFEVGARAKARDSPSTSAPVPVHETDSSPEIKQEDSNTKSSNQRSNDDAGKSKG